MQMTVFRRFVKLKIPLPQFNYTHNFFQEASCFRPSMEWTPVSTSNDQHQRRRGSRKQRERGQEIAIFRQTAANFRRRWLWVPKVLILAPNSFSPNEGFSATNFVFLLKKISDKKKIFRQAKNLGRWGQLPMPFPLPRRHWLHVPLKCILFVQNFNKPTIPGCIYNG